MGQDTLGLKEIYFENNLAYKRTDDERFSGVAQKKRKNRHAVYEEHYEDGIILKSIVYYNGDERKIAGIVLFNKYKPFVKKKEFFYRKSTDWSGIIMYNDNGKRIYEEQFENGILTYGCEYVGKKKHGQEICLNDDGTKTITEYVNGKRKK